MPSLERDRGHRRVSAGHGGEDLENSGISNYLQWLADSVTCCFPEQRDQPAANRINVKDQTDLSRNPSKLKRKRRTLVPVSRYNPSVCNQQPSRRSKLLWPTHRPKDPRPMSQNSQHQLHINVTDQASTGHPPFQNLQQVPYNAGSGEESMTYPGSHNSQGQSGVIANPDALINRPKSAYARNRRTNDEEPVFWQQSDRATRRFRHSQFTTVPPTSPSISRQPTESRRSNASNFEALLDQTFARQPALNLRPNPVINVKSPSTPSLPPLPIEENESSEETEISSPQVSSISFSQQTRSRKRFSDFRPLQLSFYLPGNRLSLLPRFSDDHDVDHNIPPVPGITRPPSALMKTKPNPMFDCLSSSHSVPRKPVASWAASLADESKCPSVQSSMTLNDGTYSRNSLLHDHLDFDRRLSRSTLRNTQDFQPSADKPLPSISRPASSTWTETTERLSSYRVSAQSVQLETNLEERTQMEFECPTISEESSPVSPISPTSPKHPSAVLYHDYEFISEARQISERRSTVEYHDYEYVSKLRQVPGFSEVSRQYASPQVTALFQASNSSSNVSDDDDELPLPSKPRSSSGSSTLYHGEFSSLISDPPTTAATTIKPTLSVAFPSPTLQHRLSDWLSRSASQIQAFSPRRGEFYGHADSPTLGFSWKDFGWRAETRGSNSERGGERGSHCGRSRAYTDGSSASTYVCRSDDVNLEKFPGPVSMARDIEVGVGVAF